MLKMKKRKAEKECDLLNCKAKDLKWLLAPGVEMSYEELEDLMHEIEDYKQQVAQAEKQMESSSSAFLTVHAATMEVLGMVGKVQYHEQFHKKGLRDVRCMFCMMVFDSYELRNRHIISCHWTVFEATVSISDNCCKFLYGNVIATAYACASICGFFIYENMSLSGRCHIVVLLNCREKNKQLRGNVAVFQKRIRMAWWSEISIKDKQM